MKRFNFALENVLNLRRQQLEMEQTKLGSLRAEQKALEAESARLESDVTETRRLLMVTGSAEAQDLAASDRYLRRLSAEKRRHAAKIADWWTRATRQEQVMVQARQRVRLLEKLKERELREWKAAVDRERENLSSELYLARWKR